MASYVRSLSADLREIMCLEIEAEQLFETDLCRIEDHFDCLYMTGSPGFHFRIGRIV